MNKLHKYLGLTLLLPFIGWAVTGVFFFIKPGYQQAYQGLAVKNYPIETELKIQPSDQWKEIRLLQSILGSHLLVKTSDGWQHLDPTSLLPKQLPNKSNIKKLVSDAIESDETRYGEIAEINDLIVTTTKDIRITLNWSQLSLRQKGPDTDFINQMYKIHYLQWTGIESVDQIMGLVGLAAVLLLALLGLKLAFKRPKFINR